MKMNWDVDTEGGGGFYEAGIYRVKPTAIEEVEAKSGNQQLRIKATICEGQHKGRKITEHITLLESCMWKLVKFVKAMGVDVTTLAKGVDTSSGEFRNLLNKCLNKSTYWNVTVTKSQDGSKDVNDIVDYQPDPDAVWEEQEDTPEFLKNG